MTEEKKKLPMCKCGKNTKEKPHQCPYAIEINDDTELCECCDDCVSICSDDI